MARMPLTRSLGAVLAATALAAVLSLTPGLATPSASAHSGPISLSVNQDGTGRIISTANYVEDGHPVTTIIDPTLTAQSSAGDFVGPIALVSAPEGEGVWITEDAVLPAGEWTVTVAVTTPEPAEVTQTLDIVIVDQTPVTTDVPTSDPVVGYLVAGAVVAGIIAIGLIIALVIVRRRRGAVSAQASAHARKK